MPFSRRDFIARSTVLGSGALLPSALFSKDIPAIPSAIPLYVLATNWGFKGNWDQFCHAAKHAGYDGIEVWAPPGSEKDAFLSAVLKYELKFAFLAGASESNFSKHLSQFEQNLAYAASMKPLFINCHSGRDYFPMEEGKKIYAHTQDVAQRTGIPIYHETHRSRLLFAAHTTRNYLEAVPSLELTLDISHWCNVHESLLDDQPEAVALALERTAHIHARIGHQEGPQVNDPRAPEWSRVVEKHFAWWDTVVAARIRKKASFITFTTEFGPANYMPTLPYTRQEIGNQWEINAYMKDLLQKRYK
ncbi:MAG: sugar phosphate isomerase/epimerase family protein [Chitinophagaceae bacterium]